MTSPDKPFDPNETKDILPDDLESINSLEDSIHTLELSVKACKDERMIASTIHTDEGDKKWNQLGNTIEELENTIKRQQRLLHKKRMALTTALEKHSSS